ncbi:unnamed protein product [Cylicocyclus nassatus]|uniref:Uncharacterized protein n=1 Tax=Cylicocyclus nassatus TaxID=53992 RepID=A0AA36HCN4_CYLNA|nr:unnamed protein product [Cylicocyclus nassatus]
MVKEGQISSFNALRLARFLFQDLRLSARLLPGGQLARKNCTKEAYWILFELRTLWKPENHGSCLPIKSNNDFDVMCHHVAVPPTISSCVIAAV